MAQSVEELVQELSVTASRIKNMAVALSFSVSSSYHGDELDALKWCLQYKKEHSSKTLAEVVSAYRAEHQIEAGATNTGSPNGGASEGVRSRARQGASLMSDDDRQLADRLGIQRARNIVDQSTFTLVAALPAVIEQGGSGAAADVMETLEAQLFGGGNFTPRLPSSQEMLALPSA